MSLIRAYIVFVLLLHQYDVCIVQGDVRQIVNDDLNEGRLKRMKRADCVEIYPEHQHQNAYFMCRRDSVSSNMENLRTEFRRMPTNIESTLNNGDIQKNIPLAEYISPQEDILRSQKEAFLQKLSNRREDVLYGHDISTIPTTRACENTNLNQKCSFTLPTPAKLAPTHGTPRSQPQLQFFAEDRYNQRTARYNDHDHDVFGVPKLNFTPDEFKFLQKFSKHPYPLYHPQQQPYISFTDTNDPVMQTFYTSLSPPYRSLPPQEFSSVQAQMLRDQQVRAGYFNECDRSMLPMGCNSNNHCNSCTQREYQPLLIALPCSHYGSQPVNAAQATPTPIHDVTPNYVAAAATDYPLIGLGNPLTTLSLPSLGLFGIGLPRLGGGTGIGLNLLRPPFLGSVAPPPTNNENINLPSTVRTVDTTKKTSSTTEANVGMKPALLTNEQSGSRSSDVGRNSSNKVPEEINLNEYIDDEVTAKLENESRKAYKSLMIAAKSFMYDAKADETTTLNINTTELPIK